VYPSEAFKGKSKYGLTVMVTTDPELSSYIEDHSQQVEGARARPPPSATCLPGSHMCVCPGAGWLTNGELQRVVVDVVRACHPYDTLERWTFAVETDKEVLAGRYVFHAVLCMLASAAAPVT
jgi:hypothetical protein